MRLIDADAFLERVLPECKYPDILKEAVENQPTIEAEPVRHGRWLSLEGWFNKSIVKCSVCGNTLDMDGVNAGRGDANFCPNCGVKMDGGAENDT